MPPKKTDIFTKDVEFMLVDLVECKSILWDYTFELYKRVDLKNAAWEEVARSLGPNFSGKYCMYYCIKTYREIISINNILTVYSFQTNTLV